MIFMSSHSAGVAEEYEGEWQDGLMHGRGRMRYTRDLFIIKSYSALTSVLRNA